MLTATQWQKKVDEKITKFENIRYQISQAVDNLQSQVIVTEDATSFEPEIKKWMKSWGFNCKIIDQEEIVWGVAGKLLVDSSLDEE